jgi:hypothetical protein
LARPYSIHPTLMHACKQPLLSGAERVCVTGVKGDGGDAEAGKGELNELVRRLKWGLEGPKEAARSPGRPRPW